MHPNQPPPGATTDPAPAVLHQGSARTGERAARPGPHGFTFIEMIVGLAIMALVATVVTPSIVAVLDRQRRDVAVTAYNTFGDAISRFATDVVEYPGQLTQLTTQIGAQTDVCGTTYNSTEQGAWGGPYLTRLVPSTGLPIGIGRARNQLTRYPNTANPAYIIVTVDSVLVEDALAVNKGIDDDGDDATANAVRWTTLSAADGLVTLGFWGPIQDLC